MNFERHNKGFTIIELVVVMVIIGILVLLVVPNMMGDTEEAKIARIKNDIKVVEGEVETYVMNGNPVPAYKDITTDIPTYVANEKLYDLSGSIVDVVAVTDHMYFRVVSGKFIEGNVDTKLDGVFLVTEKMKFFYLDVEMEAPDTPMVTGNPIITANPFTWTKDDVNITIVYPTSSVTNEYSIDGITWSGYSAPFKVSDNGLIYAKGTDDTGVETDVATLDIDYIDRVDPELVLAPDITITTSGDVTISVQANDSHSGISNIKLPDDSYIYVENGSYTATINGVYEFQTTDRAGNTTIESIDIGNINKVLPVITTVTTPSTPTNGTVVVTATTDKGTLNETSHTFMDNGSFTFIATDEYGNTASETVIVDNIDRIPPELTLTPNITTPTNGDVIITVEATDVWSGIDFITLPNDSTESTDATTYTVSSNGPYTFKATDLAGNETSQPMEIVNIGVTAPVVTIDPYITTPTNQDIIVTASTDKGTLNATSHTFTSNGSFTFTATDEHGLSDSVTVTIGNIDKTPPVITTVISTEEPTNQDVIVTASVNEGTLNETSHTFISNDSFTFTAIDSAGNSSSKIVTITNIDRTLPTVQFTPNGGTVAKAHATVVSAADAGGIASLQYEWTASSAFPSPGVWNTFNSGATLTTPANQNGNYYLHIKAMDTAGNERNATSNAFLLDNIAPNAPTFSEVDGTVTVTYSVDSNIREYRINSGSWQNYTSPIVVSTSSTIFARGADLAGNYSDESSIDVVITPPLSPLSCSTPESLGYTVKYTKYFSIRNKFETHGLEIQRYDGGDINIDIPEQLAYKAKGDTSLVCYNVIGIGNNAFKSKTIQSIDIPNTVYYLGNNSFHGLDAVDGVFEDNGLISINIPSSVEVIGNNAFHNNAIENLEIPDTVLQIGNNAFHNNNIKSLKIGAGLAVINDGVFAENEIVSLSLPSTVKKIQNESFKNNKIKDLKFTSIESIGDYAFYSDDDVNYNSINNVSFGTSLSSIGKYAFKNNKTSFITPRSSTYVDSTAFDNVLPQGLTGIKTWDGSGWVAVDLTPYFTITFVNKDNTAIITGLSAEGVTKFGSRVVIPETVFNSKGDSFAVIEIAADAFNGDGLASITILGNRLQTIGERAFLNNNLSTVTFPTNSLTSIGASAFAMNDIVGSMTLPPSITTYGDGVFRDNQLTEVALPSNMTTVPSGIFNGNRIKKLTLNEGITAIGDYAFAWNPISELSLPNTLTTIGEYAFTYPSDGYLKSLNIPSSVASIGNNAFSGLSLTEVYVPSGITLGSTAPISATFSSAYNSGGGGLYASTTQTGVWTKQAPSGCSSSDFVFNPITQSITDYVGASKDITLPSQLDGYGKCINVKKIGKNAFSAKGLTSVVLPEGIEYIDESAFSNNLITNIELPSTLIELGNSAFYNNKIAGTLVIPDTLSGNIGAAAFRINNISELLIGKNVKSIGGTSFYDNQITNITAGTGLMLRIKGPAVNIGFDSLYLSMGAGSYTADSQTGLWSYGGCRDEESYYMEFDTSTNTITRYNGTSLNVIIPSSIGVDGVCYSVEGIGIDAFKDKGLVSVEIPDTVTVVESGAFSGNILNSVIIGTATIDATSISSSFSTSYGSGGAGLYKATVQTGTWTKTNCITPSSINIAFEPNTGTITDYSPSATRTSLTIPSHFDVGGKCYLVRSIAESSFSDINHEFQTLVLPNTIESIGRRAFYNIGVLTNLKTETTTAQSGNFFPVALKNLEEIAFQSNNLDAPINLSHNIETLMRSSIHGSYHIPSLVYKSDYTQVNVGQSVQYLGEHSIYSSSLNRIKLLGGIELEPGFIDSSGVERTKSFIDLYRVSGGGDYSYNSTTKVWTKLSSYCLTPASFGIDFDHTTKTITGINNSYHNLTIPYELNYGGNCYVVENIADNAFNNKGISGKLTLPKGLVNIGSNAFTNNKIAEIQFLRLPETMGIGAFENNLYSLEYYINQ